MDNIKLPPIFLDLKKVNYIHWKSNQHIEDAILGNTDLDILVEKSDLKIFLKILEKNHYKKLESQSHNRYPGIFDFLGYNKQNGRLLHFHLHTSIILGIKHVKNYHLPIENILLETSITHPDFAIRITAPEYEIVNSSANCYDSQTDHYNPSIFVIRYSHHLLL